MKKTDLINAIAGKTEVNKKSTEAVINAFMETVEETLKAGEKVTLVGFGSFEVRDRVERKGRNPKTNEEIIIPASKAPVFKAGRTLKAAVK